MKAKLPEGGFCRCMQGCCNGLFSPSDQAASDVVVACGCASSFLADHIIERGVQPQTRLEKLIVKIPCLLLGRRQTPAHSVCTSITSKKGALCSTSRQIHLLAANFYLSCLVVGRDFHTARGQVFIDPLLRGLEYFFSKLFLFLKMTHSRYSI